MMQEQENSIGALLRSKRQKNGLSLEQITKDTKIKLNILQALEANNFDKLGGTGYAKAMILNYARYLRIEDDLILKKIKERFHTKMQYQRHDKSIQPKKLVLPGNIFAIIALFVLIIILTFLVIHLYQSGILSWPPFQNVEKKVKVKKIDPPPEKKVEPRSKVEIITENQPLPSQEKEQFKIDPKALRDTTDHLDKLLFKDKKSPLNYQSN